MPRLKTKDLEFPLPRERIAQHPRPFDEQKLLAYSRQSGAIEHRLFKELDTLLKPGDLLVVNDSRVIPAAVWRADGKEILFVEPNRSGFTNVKAICPARSRVGGVVALPGARFHIREQVPGTSAFTGDLETDKEYGTLLDYLQEYGTVPLPPYLKRRAEERDARDYQTIFARHSGSIASPTAGLHFSPELVARLVEHGIERVPITLHVGYGTFKVFKTEYVDEHVPDPEEYHVPLESLQKIGSALKEGRRVIAVGTTVTRVLESIPDRLGEYESIDTDLHGMATLFIFPPFRFKVISGLVTNFATPRNPVMSLAAAFIGLEELLRIYRTALERDYLFYSYGDALLAV